MVLAAIILKVIFCWTQCYSSSASKDVKKFLEKQKKDLSASKRQLVQLEIPMEDIERTSTPVPKEERKLRPEHHSDV